MASPNRSKSLRPLPVLAGFLAALSSFAAAVADPIGEVQQAAAEWSKVRGETVRLESEWRWQRTLLQSTLDALDERIRTLQAEKEGQDTRLGAERRELAEVTGRIEAMAAARAEAERHFLEVDRRLAEMRPALPPRLSAALELPFRSLATPDLPFGERVQHTMAILNRCMHFNGSITTGEEVVADAAGADKLMETVYWGLAFGFALDRSTGAAYAGAPGAKGWAWSAAPDLGDRIGRLIDVARDKSPPEHVEVPLPLAAVAGNGGAR